MNNLEKALVALLCAIASGAELPDACSSASIKYGVPYYDLLDAHDAGRA